MTDLTKLPALVRDFDASELAVRKEKDTTHLSFAASSEHPVERWFGEEILSHDKGAVRLDRAKRGAMPLLFNHDMGDPIGMVDSAKLADGRMIVDAHLFDTARAKEVASMLDGGLRNVSIGYRIYTVEEDVKTQVFTARDWEPYEASIVTVPADPSVGIGRDAPLFEVRMIGSPPALVAISGETTMIEVVTATAGASADKSSAEQERLRIKTISAMADQHKVGAAQRDQWIDDGMSPQDVAGKILDVLKERGDKNPTTSAGFVGLENKDVEHYSLFKAMRAVINKDWKHAGLELRASQEIQKKVKGIANENTFYVPLEIQQKPFERQQRDLTVATTTAGGFLVQTTNLGFLEILRNQSVAFQMGAFRLSGLQDAITIPKRTVAATVTWLANEASTITESTPTFAQIAMSPKTVGAYNEISRQLLLQSSPSAEQLVLTDLAQVTALAVDAAVLNGSGASGQPTGIIGTSGIGSVTGTSIAYAGIVEFQTDTATGNALFDSAGYVATPVVAGLLKGRVKFTSTASPIWEGKLLQGTVDGYRAMSSLQVPTGDLLFGDFSQVVVGEWGVLAIETNPYANFQAGIVGVRSMYSVDVAVRYPAAFSLATSVT